MNRQSTHNRGFGLIEVIIVSALSVMVFGAIFASFQYSLQVINMSRSKLSAVSVANDRMEYFRSLPYNDVGVISGFPVGTIPQNSTTSLNGIEFAEKVRVDYVDDPADGLGAADANGIITDYKRIRLEYTWNINDLSGEVLLISNIVPRSIETNAGGGSIRINVIDQSSALLSGASVTVLNSGNGYNVTASTDVNGEAIFSVPADSNYEVQVTGPISGQEYSLDQTYIATTTNPNPVRSPFAVLEADISTLTFQIGELSDMDIVLKSAIVEGDYIEEFSSLAGVASSTQVVSTGAVLRLTDVASVYDSFGAVFLGPITPTTLEKWQSVRIAATTPVNTAYRTYFYTGPGTGPYTLIPEGDLPGNSSGFTDELIDISVLDPIAYPAIIVALVLETTNSSVTPEIDEVGVYYRESSTPRANQTFRLYGTKTIGTEADYTPIYKYDISTTTDAGGELELGAMEFDNYSIVTTPAMDVASACSNYPLVQLAGVNETFELLLVTNEANTLRVRVQDASGRDVPGVEVNLSRPGYNETRTTGGCGEAFFVGDSTAYSDYDMTVTAVGYNTELLSNVVVDGDLDQVVFLTKL